MKHALPHLVLALLLVASAAGAYVFWFSQMQSAQVEVQALSAEIEAKTGEHERAGSSRVTLTELAEKEALIASHFVSAEDIVPFLESLEAAGASFGASVAVASVGDPSSDGRIILSLSITGSFDAVMRTVGVIEHGARASAVRSLSLDTSDDGVWRATASVMVLSPK